MTQENPQFRPEPRVPENPLGNINWRLPRSSSRFLKSADLKLNQGETLSDEEHSRWKEVWTSIPDPRLAPTVTKRKYLWGVKRRAASIDTRNDSLRETQEIARLNEESRRLSQEMNGEGISPEERERLAIKQAEISGALSLFHR